MRPPQCDVCDARLDPDAPTALVRAVPTAEDSAWRERAERDRIVGHPPDTGWFCAKHAPGAAELAGTHHLRDLVQELRSRDDASAPKRCGHKTRHATLGALYQALVAVLPEIAVGAGLDAAAITHTRERDWSPMDGAVPPNCPFVDITVRAVANAGAELRLSLEAAHWNEDRRARAHLTLSLAGTAADDFRVAAWTPASGSPDAIEDVRVTGELPSTLEEALFGR